MHKTQFQLVKEGIERLDEISKDAARRYVARADASRRNSDYLSGLYRGHPRLDGVASHFRRRAQNRATGILRAASRIREDAPATNTGSVPGAGDDSSLHLKRMRLFKRLVRRFRR